MDAIQGAVHSSGTTPPPTLRLRGDPVLRELVAHLRKHRTRLRREWARRIIDAQLLTAMSRKEIAAETAAIFDNYVHALETGTLKVLDAHAHDLSARIIPRGVETHEVVGIVLLLRDILARSLFGKYQSDPKQLDRGLNAYEPTANRIATTVAVSFVVERERIIRRHRETAEVLRGLNEALEAESNRIGLALHDEAGQLLAAVHLAIADVAHDLPAARPHLEKIQHRLNEVAAQLRRLSHELRPPVLDTHGLLPALEFLAEGVRQRAGLRIRVQGDKDGSLPFAVETAIYRNVQAALNNVTRHAHATNVKVDVRRAARMLRCMVVDDGVGFDADDLAGGNGHQGLGLVGIHERVKVLGGQVQVLSSPGKGTKLIMTVPVGV